ncbi:hypothetical protein B0H10DRAFT_495560 [Mycena sp. CBHHK59/15]|nr:hypothetical protein B0H10DRAFT_495560 [Mycena sp. CBHHK59/15]
MIISPLRRDWDCVRQKKIVPPSRSPSSSPKLRPTSQDFPLPPATRLSQNLDAASLDVSFTVHTASKAVPSQPRLERYDGWEIADGRPLQTSCSMYDLRSRVKKRRFSLNIPSHSSGTPLFPSGRHSVHVDVGPSPSSPAETANPATDASPLSANWSLQIQPDSLPRIFRPSQLDDQLVKEEQDSPAISSPTICELSPRERMAQFWEGLDEEENNQSGSSVPSLELRDALKLALPCPPLPVPRPHKLRKRQSASALPQTYSQSEQRFSIFSATQATNKLRKLRRPLSTPLIGKRPETIADLPKGVEQIGKGIGFTYKAPVASHSKPSICSTAPSSSVVGKLLRGGLGLLRQAKSQPKFATWAAGPEYRTRNGPPARIFTSPSIVPVTLNSPVSECGPLTPDSISFPPLPEIVGDPFAKDEMVGGERTGDPDTTSTLRLVRVSTSEYRLPFAPGM